MLQNWLWLQGVHDIWRFRMLQLELYGYWFVYCVYMVECVCMNDGKYLSVASLSRTLYKHGKTKDPKCEQPWPELSKKNTWIGRRTDKSWWTNHNMMWMMKLWKNRVKYTDRKSATHTQKAEWKSSESSYFTLSLGAVMQSAVCEACAPEWDEVDDGGWQWRLMASSRQLDY